jgi:tetratricopeptide (TPR) repeat protein
MRPFGGFTDAGQRIALDQTAVCPLRWAIDDRTTFGKTMADTATQDDQAQIQQTIEMFEVITQSQPLDYQSMEILREAYAQVNREDDVIAISRRIADAYMELGQISSAILEYETILQQRPEDKDAQQTLDQLVQQSSSLSGMHPEETGHTALLRKKGISISPDKVDDGQKGMFKVFVDSKIITKDDFEAHWNIPDLSREPEDVIDPFIQRLADKAILPVEQSLKLMSDKTRMAYLPIDRYETDIELSRAFPAEVCRRWCILPFDRMSKSILVATANPFSQQAARDVAAYTDNRLVWFLSHPHDITKNLRKAFR